MWLLIRRSQVRALVEEPANTRCSRKRALSFAGHGTLVGHSFTTIVASRELPWSVLGGVSWQRAGDNAALTLKSRLLRSEHPASTHAPTLRPTNTGKAQTDKNVGGRLRDRVCDRNRVGRERPELIGPRAGKGGTCGCGPGGRAQCGN
jgi:hypothetical protein